MKKPFMNIPNTRTTLVAAIAAMGFCFTAQASVFSVTNSNNRFFVSRSDASTTETVYYRLVGLSAYPGKHFAAQNPLQYHMTFPVNMRENSVDIQEYSADVIDRAFLYYLDNGETGSSRTYRFEVYNEDGVQLATVDRTITYGDASLSVSRSVFDEKSVTVSSDEITVKDKGYGQAYHEVPLDAYFSGVSRGYLMRTDSRLRMVVDLRAAEVYDGYQYIQVLVNQDSNYDAGAENGDPGSINWSCYMAGFSHYDEGTLPDFRKYTFPLVSAVNGCGKVEKAWNDSAHDNNTAGDLFNQRFKDGWRAADGRIAIPTEIRYLNKLGIRFDASGGGDDDWNARSVVARLQAVPVAPALLDDVEIAVTAAPVCKGSTLTISLPFNQIMTVSGTPYLCTSWGDLKYAAGSGSNVITFSDTVTAGAGTELVVSGISSGGSVESLTGALFQFLNNVSVGGRTLDPLPEPPKDGDYYMLSTPSHFLWFADRIETNSTARAALAADIDLSGIHSFRSMGGKTGFAGVLDGRGHTLSGLNSVKCDFPNSCLGLFWQIAAQGVVTNLVLADVNVRCSSLCLGIGALCAFNYGTITHCTVSGSVSTTMSGYDTFSTKMGGICSENYGTIRACQFVASPLDPETPSLVNLWPNLSVGGIAGRNNSGGLIEGCLFYALYSDYFKGDTIRGAICSRNFGTVRNCVGLHDSRSWIDGCFGEDSGASSNVLLLDAGTPFAGGQACYALNGGVTDGSQPWYQVIGVDALPRLSCTPVRGATVYPFGDGYGNRVASDWDWLQMQLDAGGIVALAEDVTTEDGNSSLTVTNRVVLDLAGHTIDAAGRFRAIQIDNGGELTLTNSVNGSGAITGGNSTYGGGLFVSHYGTFTMTGGTISGNKASYGGGVYVDGGTFTMTGGAITGNACGSDGAVRMSGTCTVSGGPIIFGNTNFNGAASNVWMGYDDKIAVNGLSAGASIGVMTSRTPTESSPATFATGAAEGEEAYFFSDDSRFCVERSGDELRLVEGMAPIPYIDELGASKVCIDYVVITNAAGDVTYGADGDDSRIACYVVTNNVTIEGTLRFSDPTTFLILCDGATLTVTNTSGNAVVARHLYVFSQANGTGAIIADAEHYGIDGRINIHGGNVTAAGGYGIHDGSVNGGIIIKGGTVTATSKGDGRGISAGGGGIEIHGGNVTATAQGAGCGIYVWHGDFKISGGSVTASGAIAGICAVSGNVLIHGGNVTATSGLLGHGIYVEGYTSEIVLGWTDPADRITASSYIVYRLTGVQNPVVAENGIRVKLGQLLADGSSVYEGVLDSTQVSAIAGKTLRPWRNYNDPEGVAIEYPSVVDWLMANDFTQSDINALGDDSDATDKLYECYLLNCSITAGNPGGALSITGFAVSNGVVSVTVQLMRHSPLGAINGELHLYGTDDLAVGFGPIAKTCIVFGDGDSTFDTGKAAGPLAQTVTATFSADDVPERFFKAKIESAGE